MKIACIGGGPAGLYFALLMKKVHPEYDVRVYERNRLRDTFGFGVVFSDATMGNLAAADLPSYEGIRDAFYHWDDIDIWYRGRCLRSGGHGFAGMSRRQLLAILGARAAQLGVEMLFEHDVADLAALGDVDLIVAADGVHSPVRDRLSEHFRPTIDTRPNRFVWLGTPRPYPAFTFDFRRNDHGLWRLHAYQYEQQVGDGPTGSDAAAPISTFIVEATDATFAASGLHEDDEAATLRYCTELFAEHLDGHPLIGNKSIWRRFPTISNAHWSHDNVVLLGDAVHTAHFSVGSGTKLAMEDSIELAAQLGDATTGGEIRAALHRYEDERRPAVESLQRAAQASLQWFEEVERYVDLEPEQFAFTLLTRSLRITHTDLAIRDPEVVREVNAWFAQRAAEQSGVAVAEMATLPRREAPAVHDPARRYTDVDVPPPMFTPFRLRDLLLVNRVVVSAMCQYSSLDGMPDDWHLAHLGSRAVGGAGLVMTEMTDVSADGRITPGCAGMYCDEHTAAWRRIVDFVHARSYARIGLQLAHAGRKGSTCLPWHGDDVPLPEGGWELLAPSPIPWSARNAVPRPMTREDMDAVRDDFVAAARRAEAAGFDLLEIHMAHGYLLSTFISPLTNQRDDEYGGSLDNRMRYPLEVFDAVRAAWPSRKPMLVRISATDWAPDGLIPDDAVAIARLLRDHECDLVDVSAGQTVEYAKPVYGRQFQTPFADRIRHEVGIATMAVGNISSYMDVNTILAAGRADLCALARAHLWDPYWTRNAAHKQGFPLPWPDPYSVLERYNPRFE